MVLFSLFSSLVDFLWGGVGSGGRGCFLGRGEVVGVYIGLVLSF